MDLPTTYLSTVITILNYGILVSAVYLLYRVFVELVEIKEMMKANLRPGPTGPDVDTHLGHDVDSYADNLLRQVQSSAPSPSPSSVPASTGHSQSQTAPLQGDFQADSAAVRTASNRAQVSPDLAQLDRAVERAVPVDSASGRTAAIATYDEQRAMHDDARQLTEQRSTRTEKSIPPSPDSRTPLSEITDAQYEGAPEGSGRSRLDALRAKAGHSYPAAYPGTSAGSLATAALPASLATALAASPITSLSSTSLPSTPLPSTPLPSTPLASTPVIRTVPAAVPLKSVALKATEFVPSQGRGYREQNTPESGLTAGAETLAIPPTVAASPTQAPSLATAEPNLYNGFTAQADTQTQRESSSVAAVAELPAELAAASYIVPAPADAGHVDSGRGQYEPIENSLSRLAQSNAHQPQASELDLPSFLPHSHRGEDWVDPV